MQTAQENLVNAQATRNNAMAELTNARENAERATVAETRAIRKRNNAEKIWQFLMVVFGLVLGLGGLIPFFAVYKKFGLKLFILCFSNYGFLLSLVASGAGIFYFFLFISAVTTIVCMFIFCFRPNLVISMINKVGVPAAIDIRRENQVSMAFEKGLGFSEVIPTDESESAIRELGAIINDIQKLGDFALEKWTK
jgi:hypothetical protein